MSTRIRAVDGNNDWTFGQGRNNYRVNLDAVAQDIANNLQLFLGDCFFATNSGIDWYNLLGGKNRLALNLSINAQILNTLGVTGILQSSVSVSENRVLTVQYQVQTVYGVLQSQFVFDTGTIGA